MNTAAQTLSKENKRFAVFILTHGRPDKIKTISTLRRCGYVGDIFLIIDDLDHKKNEYIKKYKDVVVFSKKAYQNNFDMMDNFEDLNTIVYARRAVLDIAREKHLDYFFEYEDDYIGLCFRYFQDGILRSKKIKNLSLIFEKIIDFLEKTKIDSIAFAQGGEMIGGGPYYHYLNLKRKVMNSFCFKVHGEHKDDIVFNGRMNDDVNTYLSLGKIGKLFFQIAYLNIIQTPTQKTKGGNSEMYLKYGTHVKSFYSIMAEPSCVKLTMLGVAHRRIHHKINWNFAVPKLISEKYKKGIDK